jgi:hypothetical protein
MTWYLRSLSDQDTHRGTWSGASRSVHAVCGAEFQPVALPYGGFVLPGLPPDPDQICSQCCILWDSSRWTPPRPAARTMERAADAAFSSLIKLTVWMPRAKTTCRSSWRTRSPPFRCSCPSRPRQVCLRTPCRSLERTLLVIADVDGYTAVVSIAWVRMGNASRAARLQQLVDTDGTGNISPSEARYWKPVGSGSPVSTTRPGEQDRGSDRRGGAGKWPVRHRGAERRAQVAVVFPRREHTCLSAREAGHVAARLSPRRVLKAFTARQRSRP